MSYKYKGYSIILGDFGWAVYKPNGERLGAFATDTEAEHFIDDLTEETEN